jgi:hypothetical protein
MKHAIKAIDKALVIKMQRAMAKAEAVAKLNVPVQTGSLQESIRSEVILYPLFVDGILKAGGIDYSDKIMKNGKKGRYVDYAEEQEQLHQFLQSTIPILRADLKK